MKEENNYTGAKVLSFLIPLVGLIIYAVNIGKDDNLAKDCGKWAIIGILTPIILFLLMTILSSIIYFML